MIIQFEKHKLILISVIVSIFIISCNKKLILTSDEYKINDNTLFIYNKKIDNYNVLKDRNNKTHLKLNKINFFAIDTVWTLNPITLDDNARIRYIYNCKFEYNEDNITINQLISTFEYINPNW